MAAYNFKSQFVPKIESGEKTQTVRRIGKRVHAKPGQPVQLYTGMRTKKCRKIIGYENVLYVDVPEFGQVSFHSPTRGDGPEYDGVWDGARKSQERVFAYCDAVLTMPRIGIVAMPFGKHVLRPIETVEPDYRDWLAANQKRFHEQIFAKGVTS